MKWAVLCAGVLIIGSILGYAWKTHGVACDSDLMAYVLPARMIHEGHTPIHFPPYEILKDKHPYADRLFYPYFVQPEEQDRLHSYVGNAFPILLAGTMKLFGDTSIFLYNGMMLALLFLALGGICSLVARSCFGPRFGAAAFLLGSASYLLIRPDVLEIQLPPYRDLTKYTLFALGMLLLLVPWRPRMRMVAAVVVGVLIAYQATAEASSPFHRDTFLPAPCRPPPATSRWRASRTNGSPTCGKCCGSHWDGSSFLSRWGSGRGCGNTRSSSRCSAWGRWRTWWSARPDACFGNAT